jgi:hypothetical protein
MKFSNSDWKPHEQAAQITQPNCVNQPGPLDRSPTELEWSLGLIKRCGRLRTEEFRLSIILSRVIEPLRQTFQTKGPKISDHTLNKQQSDTVIRMPASTYLKLRWKSSSVNQGVTLFP